MLKKKPVREKGKIRLSEYFKELNEGDKVNVFRELSVNAGFPKRLQGRTGYVVGKRGSAYVISLDDNKRTKHYTIKAIHLRRIE